MSFDHIREKLRAERTRQSVARQLADTPVGKLAREVDRVARTRKATQATAERLRRQLNSLTSGANREAIAKTSVARQIEEIERYSKSEGGVWNFLKRKLGPVSDVIRSLLQPSGKPESNREIEAAAELLNALGMTTEGAKGRRVSVQSRDPVAKADAERQLKALGFDVQQEEQQRPKSWESSRRTRFPVNRITPAVQPDMTSGMERRMLGGMFVYFNPNDPIVTGEMIKVVSSNVYSIGFDWNFKEPEKGTLKVRFRDTDSNGKKTDKGGATYNYYEVHPRLFIEFQNAASKGKFVWDRLRVRGTVSGHQYRYGLARISKSMYVPRQATRIGDQEWYIQREVETEGGRTIRSQLQDRMVRRLTPEQAKKLDSLKPRDGKPRDGRPNNGRPGV